MLRRLLPITALVLGLSSGAALADPPRGYGRHGAPYYVRPHHGYVGGHGDNRRPYGYYGRPYGYYGRPYGYYGGRVVVRGAYPYVRRPIYVSRPYIRYRYYDYDRRPAVIVENYNSIPGYFWVPGRWDWNGYEWIWQPGHYEPDPNYPAPGYYDQRHNNGYYGY